MQAFYSDTFILAQSYGSDLILDFEDGVDSIRLDGGLTFADLTVAQGTDTNPSSLQSQNNTLISVTATNEWLLWRSCRQPRLIIAISVKDLITLETDI